jgi:hypothetical protein
MSKMASISKNSRLVKMLTFKPKKENYVQVAKRKMSIIHICFFFLLDFDIGSFFLKKEMRRRITFIPKKKDYVGIVKK